ncbi:hypothetical protein BCF74_11423 [Knoellia remsis]|uniref:Uncharacterized protein n=1 Tax=Knoellia remsis TaxID=407159 RepID=A0A2T0UJ73_9MICO|nr:hypothetical protein [Knoellia remsis]PRY57993.1 hypothetical protein BCF74_11423 [Knoellia remsis]
MTDPADHAILSAIAAITGQSVTDLAAAFREALSRHLEEGPASSDDVADLIARLRTRLGLAPAVDLDTARGLGKGIDDFVAARSIAFTTGELAAWVDVLRHTAEQVQTVDRAPVAIPALPEHQTAMWTTLIELELTGLPWVLVGGQMTMLHCLENDVPFTRATDDGDLIVGVWTHRAALQEASAFLQSQGFREERTSDGYGYRFVRGDRPYQTKVDVLLPEGLDSQTRQPKTMSGRPGLSTQGGNQALTRAQRVPVIVGGRTGHVRRPTLLGSIVAKAHAYIVDSRLPERHAQDLATLVEIALREPRRNLRDARPDDRKPVRRFLRDKTADHADFRHTSDPEAVFNFLERMANLGR